MSNQNAIDTVVQILADGWSMAAGVIKRTLKLTGGDVTITGSGSGNVTTFPSGNTTLLSTGANEINGLTEKTTPAGADLLVIEDSAASNAKKKLQITNLNRGYALQASHASFSPLDATTYYWGGLPAEVPTNSATRYRISIPVAGTITIVYCEWTTFGGTAGSAENITLNIRLNNTTSTAIATVGSTTIFKAFNNTALSVAVAAGDFIEFELVCPTWATNPTAVRMSATIWVAQ